MFQSPRSGKFVSDFYFLTRRKNGKFWFQSPRSGKFVSDIFYKEITMSNFIVSIP